MVTAVETISEENAQETLCLDIAVYLQIAYDLSVKLNDYSGLSKEERESVSLGIHRLKINILPVLNLKEVNQ